MSNPPTLQEIARQEGAKNRMQADYLLAEQAATLRLLEHFARVAVTPCVTALSTKGQAPDSLPPPCCSSSSSSSGCSPMQH